MDRSHIVFIVPARNEELTIATVLSKILKFGHVILINDASTDNTYRIANNFKINILNNKTNIGYQKSIIKGINEAKKLNYKYAITFDADGQHKYSDIDTFLNYFKKGYDFILGERVFYNRFSEKILSYFSHKYLNTKDIISGMKGYNISKLKVLNINYKMNTFCCELSFDIINNKQFRYISIPISVSKRNDNSRLGTSIFVNLKILLIILYLLLKNMKKRSYEYL